MNAMHTNTPLNIVFTGGGSSGHVVPNLALIAHCRKLGWEVHYIGSYNGIESRLIKNEGISYHRITAGKLRRYFSFRTLASPLLTLWGTIGAIAILLRIRPDVVFSKGGFVAFPVVLAAWLLRIPVLCHESDLSPGLANRLCYPFAKRICTTFAHSRKYFKHFSKCLHTGTPIRGALYEGQRDAGIAYCQFTRALPVLMVMGGGAGSAALNQALRVHLTTLLERFNIIHICGEGKYDPSLASTEGYAQFEYVTQEMADLYACADIVLSRAGANSLYELLALQKPHVLVPLTMAVSRGDQIENAAFFQAAGLSVVIEEPNLADEIVSTLDKVFQQLDHYRNKIAQYPLPNANEMITQLIAQTATGTTH